MQAIQTKFFGWNSARRAYRIKATAPAGSVWHQFGQLHVDIEPEHEKAARALMARFNWGTDYDISGGTLADNSRVYVMSVKPGISWHNPGNDVNGNPRRVCHFLNLNTRAELDNRELSISQHYELALTRARKLGGRKFHNKSYGGGIVFQTFDALATEKEIKGITQ